MKVDGYNNRSLLFSFLKVWYHIIGDFMKIKKRIGAFLLDMFIVMLISVTLSNLSYLNPYKDKYTEASSTYIDLLDEYDELIKNTNPKEYVNEVFNFANKKLVPQLMIIEKYNVFNSLWYLIIFMLYNVLFAYFNDGQTLGKKIFKLRVVKKDGEKASIGNFLVRSLFNGSTFFFGINLVVIIRILLSILSNKLLFLILFYGVESLSLLLEISLLVTLFVSKGSRITSDYIAKTKVIDAN